MRLTRPIAIVASMMIMTMTISGAAAQPPTGHAKKADPPGFGAGGDATQVNVAGRPIVVEAKQGTLLRLKKPASTVFIADPSIADIQVKSPTLLYLTGKKPGDTVIYAVDANDNVLLNSPLRVIHNLSRLRQTIRAMVPGEPVTVHSVGGNLVMSGVVATAGDAKKVRSLVDSLAKEVGGTQIIDHLQIATPNEVNLRVRIAEVDRQALKSLGINWQRTLSHFSFQTSTNVAPASPTTLIGIGGAAVFAEIQALANDGYATTLAEPNLTTMSGQTASFLAGGEYPVPLASTTGTQAGIPTVTISFKKYGVQLAFTPTVIDASHINLRVRPTVSSLDFGHAVTENGFLIPALTETDADTTVTLGSGESFALAGLLRNISNQNYQKVPWLGDIPILGALFRSTSFQRNESELVIIVTPYLVKPNETRLASPTDGFTPAHDVQRELFGELYRQKLPGPRRGPLDAGGKGLIGPAGFRLN